MLTPTDTALIADLARILKIDTAKHPKCINTLQAIKQTIDNLYKKEATK